LLGDVGQLAYTFSVLLRVSLERERVYTQKEGREKKRVTRWNFNTSACEESSQKARRAGRFVLSLVSFRVAKV